VKKFSQWKRAAVLAAALGFTLVPAAAHAVPVLQLYVEGSTYDTFLSVKTPTCGEHDVACDDDGVGAGAASRIVMNDVAPGMYWVIVDGYDPFDYGNFVLNVSGEIAEGEACDPAQVSTGLMSCESGSSCTDAGNGFACQ